MTNAFYHRFKRRTKQWWIYPVLGIWKYVQHRNATVKFMDFTIEIDSLDEADVVSVRAVQAQQVCGDILIVAHFQDHAHVHLVPFDVLYTPCANPAIHPQIYLWMF